MRELLLVLDDDRERAAGFAAILPQLGSGWTLQVWPDADSMLAELQDCLPDTRLIALEASLAAPVVNHLAGHKAVCPVIVQWRNHSRDAAWKSFQQLWAAGWHPELVYRFNENWSEWHRTAWLPEAHKALHALRDTKANRVHAANCELVRSRFEGREAIYVEKFVRHVRVSHIRADVDSSYIEARAEEILTPGLGVPPAYAMQPRWRFSAGNASRFSSDVWSLSVQHVSWEVYVAPQVVAEVVRFAATLPSEEVHNSRRLRDLIFKLTFESARQQKPLFPG